MKKIIELILKLLSRLILVKYKPKIIGITGSVGKTSAKEAVWTVLNQSYRVRRSIKNYNNELGLPLTIIGDSAQGRSFVGWLAVFLHALSLIVKRDPAYPEVLVLEMGIDRPGDMDYLLSIALPDISILTAIGTVHAEYFRSKKELAKEKAKLVLNTPKEGWAIANSDNQEARQALSRSRARTISYGLEEKADLRAVEIRYSFESDKANGILNGLNFKLMHKGRAVPVFVPNIFSEALVYAILAGAAAGLAMEINLLDIARSLRDYSPPKGRMNIIKGIKDTYIIDDTYNSEPQSVRSALKMLSRIPVAAGAKKYAVLGDMLELGKYSGARHYEVGVLLAEHKIDKLATVGERSRDIKRGALESKMSEDDVFEFPDSASAGRFLQNRIKPGDLILCKGSQGIRMEKIVKELMADPLRAKDLLVRQEKGWQ